MTAPLSISHQEVQVSNRDQATLRQGLEDWFSGELGSQASPHILNLHSPGSTGCSSETLLLDLEWQENGMARRDSFVVRLPPPADAVPIFSSYDFDLQTRVMDLVRKYSQVPAPRVLWYEPSGTVLGAPFFIMEMLEGEPVSDNPPYVFAGWLLEAGEEKQKIVEENFVRTLAEIHAIWATDEEKRILLPKHPGQTPLQRQFNGEKARYEWVREGKRFPLIEKLFDWVESRWPRDEGETVISWGDARIGNILWRDFAPAAVLDWEMATLGPRQLDLAWQIVLHKYFQNFAATYGLPEVPMQDFMRRDNMVARYQALTGKKLDHMDWFLAYCLLRMALIDLRVAQRRIRCEGLAEPQDPDAYLFCRALIEKVLNGVAPWA